jgi:hypothetical protein
MQASSCYDALGSSNRMLWEYGAGAQGAQVWPTKEYWGFHGTEIQFPLRNMTRYCTVL